MVRAKKTQIKKRQTCILNTLRYWAGVDSFPVSQVQLGLYWDGIVPSGRRLLFR
ncbi:MAG: hypothetical protein ACJAUL_003696 [Paraglaciecola sp.]|jgi:hypothetical protein